jgi:hypothetical protein
LDKAVGGTSFGFEAAKEIVELQAGRLVDIEDIEVVVTPDLILLADGVEDFLAAGGEEGLEVGGHNGEWFGSGSGELCLGVGGHVERPWGKQRMKAEG